MLDRRAFLQACSLSVLTAAGGRPVEARVGPWNNKPTLFVNGKPTYACFYALTDCPGGRWTWEEEPQRNLRAFTAAGFRLFQIDLFLELVWPKEGPLDLALVRRHLRGVLDACPEAAIVLRWHLNAPGWWAEQHPEELVRYVNGDLEKIERTTPVRILMDDLRRTPRVSLASEKWKAMATAKTVELLRGLAKTPEGAALAGVHVCCGVYGEWHQWGFMRNEPDDSAPMRKLLGGPAPTVEERAAVDDGYFRDPAKRRRVIAYYRHQQELVADLIIYFCGVVKKNWPRPILAGTFYGYFFSMFARQATGGHLSLQKVLTAKEVDYLSAPQAYGANYRDLGGSGITRALIESIRFHGKLFLDEMDQTPSWKWLNNVDTAFNLTDVPADIAVIRRNVLESFTRGMGLWFYDFGPANHAGWWMDTRLMAEIKQLKALLERYHERPYEPAGDVLFVFDTEVYYYTGHSAQTDPYTDPIAVNRTMGEAWRSGAGIETVHLADLPKMDLGRYAVIVFANTWLLSAAQRRWIRTELLDKGRKVIFQGKPGYCDGERLSAAFTAELTAETRQIEGAAAWREALRAAGAHIYVDGDRPVHVGGGLLLIHDKDGGAARVHLRNGSKIELTIPPRSSLIFDTKTGARLL
ncbi:MAG: hypothetical protein ACK5UT_21205 [Acidobacteriota bacterium]